ncbi:hypothetical protein INR49_000789 [Caranx melampygus]|nr:hypothetical protein INR49_000789 [Caranx melampygus]
MALIAVIVLIIITAGILGCVCVLLRERPQSCRPKQDPQDIEPYSTFVRKEMSASQLNGYGSTTADFGSEAHYSCTLGNPKGVQQVTWQRQMKDGSKENLATYSNRFKQQVNAPYTGKVVFKEASLNSSSITLNNVSWQDESCYICAFNVYPDGSQRKEMCLTVQGISTVSTEYVPRSDRDGGDKEVVFSCSATGKPAPTIDWIISPAVNRTEMQTATVRNSDLTFTSSCNITLTVPPDWDGHVDCLLNKGMRGQRQERIHFSSVKVKGMSFCFTLLLAAFVSKQLQRLHGSYLFSLGEFHFNALDDPVPRAFTVMSVFAVYTDRT